MMEHHGGNSALEEDTFRHTENDEGLKMNVWDIHTVIIRERIPTCMAHQELLPDSN